MSGLKSMVSVCVLVLALGVGLYFLFPQAFSGSSAAFLLLLLVCPLGMMFMGHKEKEDARPASSRDESARKND